MLSVTGIPLAMATQHPDSASRAFTAREEVDEAVKDLLPVWKGGFGLDEKMIDYEGKLTPYHQVSWVVEAVLEHGLVPGEDFLITPRIPSERLEEAERQVMVLWGVIVANKKAVESSGEAAVRYIITPMCSSGYEVYVLQRRIMKMQKLAEEEIGARTGTIEVIPLVEDITSLLHAEKVVEGMRNALLNNLGIHYSHYRVLLGKSDTALAHGHLASSLALVTAISKLHALADAWGTPIYPIVGVGALPFRGHLSPSGVREFVKQYAGYSTVTVQSGLRYDMGREAVREVIEYLKRGLGRAPSKGFGGPLSLIVRVARLATAEYLRIALRLAGKVLALAQAVPRRRDRLSHNRYGRSFLSSLRFTADHALITGFIDQAKKVRVPRAITYSAALYSGGLPPSLIGLGQGLERVRKELGEWVVEELVKALPLLRRDFVVDTSYYVPSVVRAFFGDDVAEDVEAGIETASAYLGVGRSEPREEYVKAVEGVREAFSRGDIDLAKEYVVRAGVLRGSLG